jgi:hypothetical protein
MAYLHSPVGQRVRANNHVERTNRTVRILEKMRYKWRRRKTLVRFIVLRLDRIWNWVAVRTGKNRSQWILPRRGEPYPTGQQHRRVA